MKTYTYRYTGSRAGWLRAVGTTTVKAEDSKKASWALYRTLQEQGIEVYKYELIREE